MTFRMLQKMEMELDWIDGMRVWRAWCKTCKEIETYDHQQEAIDWMDDHVCAEEEYVDDE